MSEFLTPHGPGFSFVDRVEFMVGDRQIRAYKYLDPASSFFADHFPGHPIMPAVLLIECAAQAAGCLWARSERADGTQAYRLAQIVSFKVLQPVFPGQTLVTEATFEKDLGGLGQFSVVIHREGTPVAGGRIVLAQPPQASTAPFL